ncbi:hypothetical protein EAO71_24840 [Streptomyces sp. ms191]|nr:hypothetical protein EAO71_24840 [Streptomyces sp. ms191]
MTPSPDTVSRLRKFPSRIETRAASSRSMAAASTCTVPTLRDRPPLARVPLPLPPPRRAAVPDSTVSLPKGLTVLLGPYRSRLSSQAFPVFHRSRTRP